MLYGVLRPELLIKIVFNVEALKLTFFELKGIAVFHTWISLFLFVRSFSLFQTFSIFSTSLKKPFLRSSSSIRVILLPLESLYALKRTQYR